MSGRLRLTVLGTGYLGVTHAACVASLGFDLLIMDADLGKVGQLNAVHLPICEPGLREFMQAGLDSGRLTFSTSYPRTAAFGDAHSTCVGAPPQPGSGYADLSQVRGCASPAFLRTGLNFGGGAGGVLGVTARSPDDGAAGNGSRGFSGMRLSGPVPRYRVIPVRAVPLAAFIPSRVPGRSRGAWGGFASERSGGANQRGVVPAGWRGAE